MKDFKRRPKSPVLGKDLRSFNPVNRNREVIKDFKEKPKSFEVSRELSWLQNKVDNLKNVSIELEKCF